MLSLILTSVATAGEVLVVVNAEELVPGQAIASEHVYTVEMPLELAPGSAIRLDESERVGRVARQVVPVGSVLREAHLFPVGTPPGLDGFVPANHQLLRVLSGGSQSVPQPSNVVDLWVNPGTGYCVAAAAVPVAAVDSADGTRVTTTPTLDVTAAWVVVPDTSMRWLRDAEPVLALRNPTDGQVRPDSKCTVGAQ